MDASSEFKFRFNPITDITFVETRKNTKSLGNQLDVTESKTNISIQQTSDGYRYIATPFHITKTRNGVQLDDPILSIIEDISVTYELDSSGQIVEIEGIEQFAEVIKEKAKTNPLLASPAVAAALSEEAMSRKERAEWDARISSFVGREAKIGDVWTSSDAFVLPNGQLAMFDVGIKFVKYTRYDVLDCLQLQMAFNTDAEQISDFLEKTWDEMSEILDSSPSTSIVSDFEIVGGGLRLVDPNTMLIFSETIIRRIKAQLTVPRRGTVPYVVQEKKEFTFDYPAHAIEALVKRLPSGN